MTSLLRLSLFSLALAGCALVAQAQSQERFYANSGAWTVSSEVENGRFMGCFAARGNHNNGQGYGSVLRIGVTGNLWLMATDFTIYSQPMNTNMSVDGS